MKRVILEAHLQILHKLYITLSWFCILLLFISHKERFLLQLEEIVLYDICACRKHLFCPLNIHKPRKWDIIEKNLRNTYNNYSHTFSKKNSFFPLNFVFSSPYIYENVSWIWFSINGKWYDKNIKWLLLLKQ